MLKLTKLLATISTTVVFCGAFPASAQWIGGEFEFQLEPNYELEQMLANLNVRGIEDILTSGAGYETQAEEASFGTGVNYTTIPAASFEPSIDSGTNRPRLSQSGGPWPGTTVPTPLDRGPGQLSWCLGAGTPVMYDAPVQLPSGAKIVGLSYDVLDGDAARSAGAAMLSVCDFADTSTSAGTLSSIAVTAVSGVTPGAIRLDSPAVDHTVDNQNCTYSAVIVYNNCPAVVISHRVRVAWQRQITPAPTAASFTDVSISHPFFREIEAMKSSGITGGCTATQYCPDSTLTRAQMAAFLARGLGL